MAGRTRSKSHRRADLILDSLASGVLGGSAVALFFLLLDLLDGRPLYTPSLLGSVILHGVSPREVTGVDFEAVAYFSLFHIAAFTALGAAISLLVHEIELHSQHPAVVLLVLLGFIEVGFLLAAPLWASGIIASLGFLRVGVANLVAALTMTLYFVLSHRTGAWETLKHTSADLLFDAFYSGAIGGSVVALFFLAGDLLNGQPLLTPSLIGGVMFQGAAPEAVTEVRLDAIAYYSIVHMLGFGVIGAVVAIMVHEAELHSRHPIVVLLVLFALIEVSFFLTASVAMPGVVARLGVLYVFVANLLAAGAMAVFFVLSHRAGAWEKLKHAAHLA